MDPLTHTLFGATLGEAGLKRQTALAMPTLLIGANLPDVDVLAYVNGADAALGFRRGWTHGVLAMAILPLVLAGLMFLWGQRRGLAVRLPNLVLLSYISVWSHPALDWLNNYGVRLLMPFDGTWFYGDAVFIMDPWLWLLLGGMLYLNRSGAWQGPGRWIALAVVTSVPVVAGSLGGVERPGVTHRPWGILLWVLGLAAIVLLDRRLASENGWNRGRYALAATLLYMLFMVVNTRVVEQRLVERIADLGWNDVEDVMVSPVPLDALARTIVVARADEYRFAEFHWLDDEPLRFAEASIRRQEPTAAVEAALVAPCIQGMVNWMRFPFFEEREHADGVEVWMIDARYARRPAAGFGADRVVVGPDLRHRCGRP